MQWDFTIIKMSNYFSCHKSRWVCVLFALDRYLCVCAPHIFSCFLIIHILYPYDGMYSVASNNHQFIAFSQGFPNWLKISSLSSSSTTYISFIGRTSFVLRKPALFEFSNKMHICSVRWWKQSVASYVNITAWHARFGVLDRVSHILHVSCNSLRFYTYAALSIEIFLLLLSND